ncbi:SDR family NAD(P)-dependent oxidoreductase [Pseudomaricurvus sp. HS19]|uniref:SDR family NAD(P)-dependent oxidoreductase n=1 Tax=Pseudomaricurvus sp. HS19 TaxID=2692626 RepID=UPI00136D20D8|nr:SDR family NAD(P)-dependent oxidoreductase [Pseudomaricurvus sp. HS19]MYM64028.1 SDR family NAD(P)-dependent oxidoreductase [Pseudomaricurvus sp. HS19]
MENLSGKTAIVTGGASGIGLGIVRALYRAGMNVAIADIQADALERTAEEFGSSAGILTWQLDVTDRDAYMAFADAVEQQFGNIHLLVNNAGVLVSGPAAQASFSDWDWVINVNLVGAINGVVIVLPKILAHGEGGHIVNTSSTSGILPHPGAAIYVTTKSALVGMSESLRSELEPRGVGVSVFCPGPVQSGIGMAVRNRPATYAGSGYGSSQPGTLSDSAAAVQKMLMTADEAGEIVRKGIEHNWLYIFTHSEYREGLRERAAAIDAAVPAFEESPFLKSLLVSAGANPAYAEEIQRRTVSPEE